MPEIELKVDCKELLNLLKSKIDDGVANFFAGFSKVMAENIDNQCRAFHIFSGGNASKSVLVKQAFENAKEKQIKAYKQMASKDDFTTQRRKAPSFSYGDIRRNALGLIAYQCCRYIQK